ncbi:MAG: PAS domain S-box protein [Planctomycetota bacterium]|jgi:PAS domain S-box-containing protein
MSDSAILKFQSPGPVVDALPVLISFANADRKLEFCNTAFATWLGRPSAEIPGMHLQEVLGDAKYSELKPHIDAALFGKQVSFETTLTGRDGDPVQCQVIHVPKIDEAKKVNGFYSLVTDVSEIRRSQRALSNSEAMYHSLVEQLPMCLIRKDLDGRFTYVNPQFCEFAGRAADELVGHTDGELFPAELAAKYRKDDQQVLDSREVMETIERHQIEGEPRPRYVQVLKTPIYDAAQRIVGTQVLFWDVTEKHAAEETLRESTALKRAIFDSALDCIVIVDQDGEIIDVNRATEQVFGYSRDELIGGNIDERFFPPELDERQRSNRERYGDGSETGSMVGKRIEVPAMRKDGSSFFVEMAMQPVPYMGRTVFAMFLHDVTERKKHREEIAQKNRDLETLLYVTSHDLREPLRAIRSFSELLRDRAADKLEETEGSFLTRVIDGADRLDRLLEDVLMLSRAQRASEANDLIDPRIVIDDVLKQLDPQIIESQAVINVDDFLPRVRVDPRWLRQSVFNLVANALKFVNPGERPDVQISGYERSSDEGTVTGLVIHDRGPGIPEEHTERVFQLFQRAVGRKVEGTGAGLAIVRQVARRYGGNAWVEARPEGGSSFYLAFST